MTLSAVILVGLVICAGSFSFWVYSRLEMSISYWKSLATLRFLTLSVLLTLIWDPIIPVARTETKKSDIWVLLDGSHSMRPTDQFQSGPVEEVDEILKGLGEAPVRLMLFGDRPRFIPLDSLGVIDFKDTDSRLGPALMSAAEAGAIDALVLSDFRISDVENLDSYGQQYGLNVKFELVDMERRNVGVKDFKVFKNGSSEETVVVQATIFSEGLQETESINVQIFEEDNLVTTEEVNSVSKGNTSTLEIVLPNPKISGLVEYRIALEIENDNFRLDNYQTTFFEMGRDDTKIVFLSVKPDWEPRFLMPVLSEVSGLAVEGFLMLRDGQFLSVNDVETDEVIATELQVKRAATSSKILIVHGLSGDSPDWIVEILDKKPSSIVFVEDGTAANILGVATQQNILEGEWYLENTLKPSPLASTLSGLDLTSLAPLNTILPMLDPNSHLKPLEFRRNGLTRIQAPLILTDDSDGRQALVLATGFWRWSSRGGNSREVYRRLWSGILGWLMASEITENRRLVEPELMVWGENSQSKWNAWGLAGNNIHLMIYEGEQLVKDTTVNANAENQFTIEELEFGSYRYRATDVDNGDSLGTGRFSVEEHSLEWFLGPKNLSNIPSNSQALNGVDGTFGRPLHTFGIPYLLIIVLLSLEWIGRRQRGLR